VNNQWPSGGKSLFEHEKKWELNWIKSIFQSHSRIKNIISGVGLIKKINLLLSILKISMCSWLDVAYLSTKPPAVTLSRFRSGLREDLCRDFFARGICDIEYAYQIVWDLDVLRESYFQGNLDYKRQSTKSNSERSQYKNSPNTSIQKEDDKWKWYVESVPGPTLALNVINARLWSCGEGLSQQIKSLLFWWATISRKGRYTEESCVPRQLGEWLWWCHWIRGASRLYSTH